jgi:hypothetical protein
MTEPDYAMFHKELIRPLLDMGMEPEGTQGRAYELYIGSFATVQLSINRESETLVVERFYDSERLSCHNISKVYHFPQWKGAVELCRKLIHNIKQDYPILGGINEE